jgi:hypothetical protein
MSALPKLGARALQGSALFAAAGVGVALVRPHSAAVAVRLAAFSCLAPAIGCTMLALIHRITGGQWAAGLRPFLRAGAALLPWTWVIAAPLMFFLPVGVAHAPMPLLAYDGLAMTAVRAIACGALFFWLKGALSDGLGDDARPRDNPRPWIGPFGLIAAFFALTILADDWLQSMDPGTHSTAFALVWICGQTVCALALCILCALAQGAAPGTRGPAGRTLGNDWGNLLLATTVFWTYVAFAQFLIIWAADLPREVPWYVRRESGGWQYLPPAVALLGFGAPLLLLLSRRVKASVAGLAWAAALILGSQIATLVWMVVPAEQGISRSGALLVACFLAAAGGLFLNRFLGESSKMKAPS